MDRVRVGKAISRLRKIAGYTQRELAEQLGVSDKTISKWERGAGLPDIELLSRLSIILGTDTDGLLSGSAVHHDTPWVGRLILDDSPAGVGVDTILYDKPLADILLSFFVLSGINEISIFAPEKELTYFHRSYGDGCGLGLRLSYDAPISKPENGRNAMTVFGRHMLYGVDQTHFFHRAMSSREHLTILSMQSPGTKERKETGEQNRVEEQFGVKAAKTAACRDLPILFSPAETVASCRSEDDVRRAIHAFAKREKVYVQMLNRGFVDFLLENRDDVADASTFLRLAQQASGTNIYCLEEIAWRRGLVDAERLRELACEQRDPMLKSYLLRLCEGGNGRKK